MPKSTVWRAPRYMILIVVAVVHLGLIGLLLMASSVRRIPDAVYRPLELVYIPTPPLPKVRAESGHPLRLRADIALSLPTPVLTSGPAFSTLVRNRQPWHGVDWVAEAHRAVRAYEIRRDHPVESTLSGSSPANDWWPQQGPHAGEQFKTDGGDWIVWISPDCYKVAGWHSADPALDSSPPQIICVGKSGEPHGSP